MLASLPVHALMRNWLLKTPSVASLPCLRSCLSTTGNKTQIFHHNYRPSIIWSLPVSPSYNILALFQFAPPSDLSVLEQKAQSISGLLHLRFHLLAAFFLLPSSQTCSFWSFKVSSNVTVSEMSTLIPLSAGVTGLSSPYLYFTLCVVLLKDIAYLFTCHPSSH